MKTIPYGRQHIDKKDIIQVSKTLNKDKITTGTEVIRFENQLNRYLNYSYQRLVMWDIVFIFSNADYWHQKMI